MPDPIKTLQAVNSAKSSNSPLPGIAGEVGGSLISSATNIYLAGKNRKFQERMSNTAHQREKQDLIKAGLNPILSAMKGGGAATPTQSAATTENPLRGQSAIQIQRDLAKSQISKNLQDVETNSALEGKFIEESGVANTQWQNNETTKKLLDYQLNEAKSISDLFKNMGQGGKATQLLMPLLLKYLSK